MPRGPANKWLILIADLSCSISLAPIHYWHTGALMKQFISHDPPDGGHPHSYLLLVMCGFAFSCAFLLLVVFFSFSCDSVAVFMFFSWEFVFFMGNHN